MDVVGNYMSGGLGVTTQHEDMLFRWWIEKNQEGSNGLGASHMREPRT